MCLLTPIFFKKMCNNKLSIMKAITTLLEDNDKTNNIQKELDDDRLKNPFVVISKHK